MGLPMDDDWLYETFGIEKPKNYDQQKADALAIKQALSQKLNDDSKDNDDNKNDKTHANKGQQNDKNDETVKPSSKTAKTPFKSRLKRFFAVAPKGAATDF